MKKVDVRIRKRFALFPISVYEKLTRAEGRYVNIWLRNYYTIQKRRPSGDWKYLHGDYLHKEDAEFFMTLVKK